MKDTKSIYYFNKLLHTISVCFLYFIGNILLYGININIDNDKSQSITMEETQNKVPVVNINKPDLNGISHNYFKDYNVGKNGIILNNGKNVNNSELGGQINRNPNLQNSAEAKKIITEVTGTNISKIEGFTEIVGGSADYILANPNGIYINKAGFINTPNVTITTGKLGYIDGDFTSINIERGHVTIGEDGVDARNTTRFDIISRTAELNGKIYGGKEVNIILGKNRYNVADGTVDSNDGSGEGLALDAGALGSIYAGKIYLKSSDKGVGVNSSGVMLADTNDLTIDVNGDLTLKDIAGKTGISIVSNNFVSDGQVLSEKTVKIVSNSSRITDRSAIKGRKVIINSNIVENYGEILGNESIGFTKGSPENSEESLNDETSQESQHFINYGKLTSRNINILGENFTNYGYLVGDEVNIAVNSSLTNLGSTLGRILELRGNYLENIGFVYSSDSFRLDFNSIVNLGNIVSKNDGTLNYRYLKNGENGVLYTFNNLIYEVTNIGTYTENAGIFGYGNSYYIDRDGIIIENIEQADGTVNYYIGASYFSAEEMIGKGIKYSEYDDVYDERILVVETNSVVSKNIEAPNFAYVKYIDKIDNNNEISNENEKGNENNSNNLNYLDIYDNLKEKNLLDFNFYISLNEIKLNEENETHADIISDEEDEEMEDRESKVIKELLNNGKEVAISLGLIYGQPLTENQILNLSKDIIWFEKIIDNEVEILQAKIYLSTKTIDEIAAREGKSKIAIFLNKSDSQIKNINDLNNRNSIKIKSKNEDAVNTKIFIIENEKENGFQKIERRKLIVEVVAENNSPKVVVKEDNNVRNDEDLTSKANADFLKFTPENVSKTEKNGTLDGDTVRGIIESLSSLSDEN